MPGNLHVPAPLHELCQWVCWGKPGEANRKCPYDPRTGQRAKAGVPDTWAAFSEAVGAVQAGRYEGIGFEFAGDGGIVGVDFDHCIQGGALDAWAADWVRRFDSYTEVSPSGEGLHILCKGILPANIKRPRAEMYDRARYFTFTGKAWDGAPKPIRDAQEDVDALYRELQADAAKGQQTPAQPPPQPPPALPPEKDYIATALARDEVFARLWRGGRPNGNESADDMALMNKLAYWCSADPVQMQAAFLQSGHFQTKDEAHRKKTAQRPDYLQRTIDAALAACTRTAAQDDADFHSRTQGAGAVQPDAPESGFAPFEPFDAQDADPLPPFPSEALPPVMRQYAEAIAASLQVPVDMPAAALLAVAALSVQGVFKIHPMQGWYEPLNLYVVIIAPPSEKKSPVLAEATRYIHSFEAEENERRAPEIRAYQVKSRILAKQVAALTDRAGKPAKAKSDAVKAEALYDENAILEKQRELDELEEVRPLRLLADDVTPEALTSLLAANGGRMGVMSAEGGLFGIMAGLYSGDKANIDMFLKAYTGDVIRVDRKGRASEYIPHPALSMLFMIQPQVLHEIMQNNEFKGRGLLARFLYCAPQSLVGHRVYRTPDIPDGARDAWNARLNTLLTLQADAPEKPCVIHFSPEAEALDEQFFYQLEPRLVDDLEDVGDWAGKYRGQIMRIAGVLHCIENGEDAGVEALRASTLQAAIDIGQYFLSHSLAAFRRMGACEGQEVKDAKYILKRLLSTGKMEISRGELFHLCKGRLGTSDGMKPGLEELVRRGYIRIDKASTGGRGRPSETVVLNQKEIYP